MSNSRSIPSRTNRGSSRESVQINEGWHHIGLVIPGGAKMPTLYIDDKRPTAAFDYTMFGRGLSGEEIASLHHAFSLKERKRTDDNQ